MALELFFLRHAVAVERGAEGITDEARPLTEEGREKMILAVQGMGRLKIEFEVLLSSPLLRAKQTAELVARHLPFRGPVEFEEELEPGGDLRVLLGKLAARRESRYLLVGHEPMLGSWIRSLLGWRGVARLRLKKGALCHLLLEGLQAGAGAELIELFQPKALRLLGRKPR
ncbi:MAG: histidine phosphatase family protein [bacterium]